MHGNQLQQQQHQLQQLQQQQQTLHQRQARRGETRQQKRLLLQLRPRRILQSVLCGLCVVYWYCFVFAHVSFMVPYYNSVDHHFHHHHNTASSIDRTLLSFFYHNHSFSEEKEKEEKEPDEATAQFSNPTNKATTIDLTVAFSNSFSNSNSNSTTNSSSRLSSKSSGPLQKIDTSTDNKEGIVSNVLTDSDESTPAQQQENLTSKRRSSITKINPSSPTQQTTGRLHHHHDDNESKYWRYDEASPTISKARTHFLVDSIPQRHRLPKNFNFDNDFDSYLSSSQNKWPSKLHLFEINPCLAVLPEQDRRRLSMKTTDNNSKDNNNNNNNNDTTSQFGRRPVYIASYRVTHLNNCFSYRPGSLNMLFDDASFDKIKNIKTDYLGIAILDHDLNIITSQVVTFDGPHYPFTSYNDPRTNVYDDYRVHNLHGDQLYLSTRNMIIPLYLNLDVDVNVDVDFVKTIKMAGNEQNTRRRKKNQIDDAQYVMIPPAFPESSSSSTSQTNTNTNSFSVHTRAFPSCGVYGQSNGLAVRRGKKNGKTFLKKARSNGKNFLYFVDDNGNGNDNDSTGDRNHTPSNATTTSRCKLLHYPRWNPNDVRDVELDTLCGRQQETEYDVKKMEKMKSVPLPSFRTIDEQYYPNLMNYSADNGGASLFMSDRGSACCVKMVDPVNGKKVLVGISHPKTPYPGKKLPNDVETNTYLSRFFAFESHYPYSIVARSGMFCFGYPTNNNDDDGIDSTNDGHGDMYPSSAYKMAPLQFANVTHNCPKIHFVTGIIDKVSNDLDEDSTTKVIISYGVSDCLSRFIEVDKTEIAKLLWSTPS